MKGHFSTFGLIAILSTPVVAQVAQEGNQSSQGQEKPVNVAPANIVPALDKESTLRLLTSGGPGNYDFITLDKTKLQAAFYENVFMKQDADYKYFLTTVNSIEQSMIEFMQMVYHNSGEKEIMPNEDGLYVISVKSTAGVSTQMISSSDFLLAVNRFQQAKLALEIKVKSLTAIAEGKVSNGEELLKLDPEAKSVTAPREYGMVNFQPIINFFQERINVIEDAAKNLGYVVSLPGGSVHIIEKNSGKGLVLEVQTLAITPDKMKEMKETILEKRMWDEDQEIAIRSFTASLMNRVATFNRVYGKTERFRGVSQDEVAKRNEEARTIMGIFWSRSYLRAIYGMPICTVGINYDKRWAHLDVFTTATSRLLEMHQDPVCDGNTLVSVAQNYRNLLKRADARAESIMDGNLGIIGTVENLLTFLGGNRTEAIATQAMLRLLAADAYEEKRMMDGVSMAEMREIFQRRYYSTEADEIFFRRVQMTYDEEINGEWITDYYTRKNRPEMIEKITNSASEDDGFDSVAGQGTGENNPRTLFMDVELTMQIKQADLLIAEQIEAQLANAINPNNKFALGAQKRKKNL